MSILLLASIASCSRAEKRCEDFCAAGNACVAGKCVPLECTPACGPGTACEMGQCVAVAALSCSAPCGPCQACDTSGAQPACVGYCGPDATCDAQLNKCVATAQLHLTTPALQGPFTSGYQVTAACVGCHPQQAQDVMGTIHWKWAGPTPELVSAADLTTILNPGTIGKQTLVNDFCVAVPSNEKRCDQCHVGYGGDPDPAKPQKSARAYAKYDPADATSDSSIPLANRIDCLVCHSDPTAGYAKDPKSFGNPVSTLNLATAAQDIRMPTRTNCGACHFYAGGGDNVKLMGSSLKNPTAALDVHMGRGLDCASCHASPGHLFKGAGVHVPANFARAACTDCHGPTPHQGKVAVNGAQLDAHAAHIACQTCHIPAFSRGQFGKMDWDWSTAGNNTLGAAGVVTTKVDDLGQPSATGTAVTTYDFIKGSFRWMRNVKPAYAWSNGRSTHALVSDKGDLGALGVDGTDANRIVLGMPVGSRADGKIAPFKLFRGRQAVYVDGANGFVIVPNVFGPGSLWGVIQAPGYAYSTQTAMDDLWSTVFATGASKAGQIALASGQTKLPKLDVANGVTAGWDWRYTMLYMDLDHEVAPKASALGAGGACTDCHGGSPKLPLCELYAGAAKPWGVTCP